ncbi:MAG TPA: DUF6505 family protein [Aurantimonas sp.]|jgi:hypothetical protein|nr:DUF6505 family protein [Aurantimonas sp.]
MALKLPRTIRLDPSDTFVFARAAEPGEWAVSGSFCFFNDDVSALGGQERQAFRSGFLGITSFAWSTLVVVTQASDADREAALAGLAAQLVDRLGAPDMETARAAAAEEIAFAASLCDHPVNTILAVQRSLEPEGIRERFRTLHKREGLVEHGRAFDIVVEDEADYVEHVDLLALRQDKA